MKTMARRIVRERIDPRLTASLFANYRSSTEAVLELVDNAVDSRVAGQPLEVDLSVRPATIAITVVGGTGMSAAQLEREYLRWGASPKRRGDRIGRYGQGGKAAIGHLGNRFAIQAGPMGDVRSWAFRDDDYRDRSRLRSYELHERAKPVDAALGYVKIEIGQVDRRVDPAKLRARIADTYRPLLVTGHLALRVNGTAVEPADWPVVESHRFSVRAGGRLIQGWYGLVDEPVPPDLPAGIRTYHLGRLVGEPAWFGHPGPAKHPGLARLIGEVELPHVPVTMNKSDFEHDSDAWAAVEERMHRLLRPIVRRLARDGAVEASPHALRTAEQVRRILARALRLLESGQLFESATAAPEPMQSDGQLTLHDAAEVEPVNEPAPPARLPTPPRPEPPGERPARRGFGEIVIRSLDPRIRSALVVEDGVRRVVINSRYPLYEVRKGDLWYQLETALREICVTIPESTVPEFERKVNELMLLSLQLGRRPRRRRTAAAQRSLRLDRPDASSG
jgi:hypothetical protein